MSRSSSLGDRLYRGETGIDFVGRRRTWFIVSGVLVLISLAALGFRGLNLGIEFQGGAVFSVPSATCSIESARDVASEATGAEAIVTETGAGIVRVQTPPVEPAQSQEISRLLADACGVPAGDITVQVVGPTWGAEITSKGIQALVVFLVLVTLFLAIYFEWRFAVAALIALAHDIILTVGIYAVTGRLLATGQVLHGAANIGIRPQFEPPKELLEPYFFDFSGDLYGQEIEVAFHHFLRGEAKFDSLEALIEQMDKDCAEARRLLSAQPL